MDWTSANAADRENRQRACVYVDFCSFTGYSVWIEHRRVLLYIPVCAEQRSFSVVFASRMRAGIFCVLLQCRKAGAISFRIYSGFSPRNNRMHPIFIDPTTDMDWEMGLQASGSSKTADSAQTADSSNGKMEKKLGKESPVYIKENGKFKERYGFIHG